MPRRGIGASSPSRLLSDKAPGRRFSLRHAARARAMLACGLSRKNSSEVPLEKQ
jgi:hypothetical protein